jgi:hypothetical protein
MALDSEMHNPKNEGGRFLDHPEAGRFHAIQRLQVIQLAEFVVSLLQTPDRVRMSKKQAPKAHWMIQYHDNRYSPQGCGRWNRHFWPVCSLASKPAA